MQNSYDTARLSLNKLSLNDIVFIRELLNTPGWITFIGDRNIDSDEAAAAYIQKIMDNPNIEYWIVTTKGQQIPIGVITFIKRDYLDHHDIGFAFLPGYNKQGYAYEGAKVVLDDAVNGTLHKYILATTLRENTNSIRLLEKLGLNFSGEIKRDDETLLVYSTSLIRD